MYKKAIFIFRRDLRLEDNKGLLYALEHSQEVLPIFIFDPRQIDKNKNPYFSKPAFSFLCRSLQELDEALKNRHSKLYIYEGIAEEVITTLIKNEGIDAVMVNKDYTPFARTRDKAISDCCEKYSVTFKRHDDLTLSPIETIRTGQEKIYTVFTPFKNTAIKYPVKVPSKNNFSNYFTGNTKTRTVSLDSYSRTPAAEQIVCGGRSEALAILHNNFYLKNYSTTRNLPATHGTSRLSAHHKFGTISIRETYAAVTENGSHNTFISELYWRDFYYYIAYHFPVVFKKSFLPWANFIKWENDKEKFTSWCNGMTGVPIVDAGMRELNTTGWIHNRSRMIVASYLSKNLLIDWRWGEQYFATKLVDYDPAQNNGGWQWSASSGADPKPIRVFNPYTQASKYDPEAAYIKHWVKELNDVPDESLTNGKTINFNTFHPNYPAPLVDQKESYHRALETYKQAKIEYKKHHITT